MPFDTSNPARLCCMISGGGRTVLNLQDAIERGEVPGRIALVIASGTCAGIERCEQRGLRVVTMPGVISADALGATLREHAVDLVALAGYLKIVRIPAGFSRRVINIHPALLPKFGGKGMHGMHVHAAVIAAGERESGCTVHYCDEQYDTGQIILQARCPVLAGDTAETLAARVFGVECEAYPKAIAMVLRGL